MGRGSRRNRGHFCHYILPGCHLHQCADFDFYLASCWLSHTNPFTNLSGDEYYAKAAVWAYSMGMVSGTEFDVSKPCTRAMTMEYLWKQAGSPATAASEKFTDVAPRADYASAVAWAVNNGITVGTSGTTFSPDSTCTRGQIMTFLYRAAR